jgi:hypothetical protein
MQLADVRNIVERDGANMLALTINKNAPELAKGKFPRRKCSGTVQINVTPGILHGGPGADGATYVDPGTNDITTLFADRKLFYSQVKIPIGVASAADSPAKGVHLINQRYDEQMGTLVMSLGMSIFDSVLGVVGTGGTIAANAVSIVFPDATRFREGMKCLWNDNGTVNSDLFTVTSVTLAANGVGGTVVFSTDATGTIVATDDSFIIADSRSGRSVQSLVDLAGTGNVYTQAAAITGYTGTTVAHNNAYSAEAVLKLATRMRQRGANPKLGFCGPAVEAEHRALYGSSTYRQFNDDAKGKLDPYGTGEIEINGIRFIVTPNCPAQKLFLVDPDTTKLGVFKDWGSLNSSGDKAEYSQVSYNYLIGQHGQFNVICDNRRGVGALTGITFA